MSLGLSMYLKKIYIFILFSIEVLFLFLNGIDK